MSPARMRPGCGMPSSPAVLVGTACGAKPVSGLLIHPLLGEERAARQRHCQRHEWALREKGKAMADPIAIGYPAARTSHPGPL
jgi:hypothetical protein